MSTEHTVGYACPASELAQRLGRSETGCWFLELGATVAPYDSLGAAKGQAESFGSVPSRWNFDHRLCEQNPHGPARHQTNGS